MAVEWHICLLFGFWAPILLLLSPLFSQKFLNSLGAGCAVPHHPWKTDLELPSACRKPGKTYELHRLYTMVPIRIHVLLAYQKY